jgi:ribosomal protein S18 acetylase RimI-like enzyme
MNISWCFEQSDIDWNELSELYRVAPLGVKPVDDLEVVFTNSKFKCFVFDGDTLIGVGRALADGRDCSYICDIAIHPKYQGLGLGKQIIVSLVEQSRGHRKIILYANPGKEGFYSKLGFRKMNTAMAIFQNEEAMINNGTISETQHLNETA